METQGKNQAWEILQPDSEEKTGAWTENEVTNKPRCGIELDGQLYLDEVVESLQS